MGDTLSGDQEKRVKRLKRVVEGWRVVLLHARAVLLWEQAWHPALVVGALSLGYVLVWLLDPNSLTLLASIGLIVNMVDLLVPLATSHLVPETAWTGAHERQLDELCRSVVLAYGAAAGCLVSFQQLRTSKPLVYYAISISALFILLWLGKSVNNGRLLFIVLVALSLLPGALHRGLPCKLQTAFNGVVATKKEN